MSAVSEIQTSEKRVISNNTAETEPNVAKTWEELREIHRTTLYSDLLKAFFERSKKWRAELPKTVDKTERQQAIAEQIVKAKKLLTDFKHPNIRMTEPGKIFAQGTGKKTVENAVLTRMYIGVDPRRSADAFKALIGEMIAQDCMKDIDIAFNTEEVETGNVTDNTLIIYEPHSDPAVLNKVMTAYRNVKEQHPEIFDLSPHQKAKIMETAFMNCKAVIDANASFVEMAPEDGVNSWDANVILPVKETFGLFDLFLKQNFTYESWLEKIAAKEKNGVVFTRATQTALDKGQLKTGDTAQYKRRLSAPALYQPGSFIVK